MTNSRVFQVLASLAIAVLFFCAQQALAQSPHHLQIRVVSPGAHADKPQARGEKKALEQLFSGFGALPPVDGGGNDEWPCFPNQNANGADCSQISTGGVVIGQPAYTQSLTNCDASAAGAPNCGQIFWFYEDDTGNNTDVLVVSVVVKQGRNYILDTGLVNFGPNPFPAGSVIVVYDDTAFGTLGQIGPNNGFCAGGNQTCVNPVKGVATVTITTTVGTSTIKSSFNMFFQ